MSVGTASFRRGKLLGDFAIDCSSLGGQGIESTGPPKQQPGVFHEHLEYTFADYICCVIYLFFTGDYSKQDQILLVKIGK